MCSIRERNTGRHICGGTLIDKNWVMTAAHCLDPTKEYSAGMSPFIYCNIYEREERTDSKRFNTRRCYLHHLWNSNVLYGNDIALCELENSADLPIPDLANIGDGFNKGDVFTVIGWGRTSSRSDLAEVLQIGKGLGFVSSAICTRVEDWAGRIKDSMICIGRGSPNTCRGKYILSLPFDLLLGDSGGPLLVPHEPTGRPEQKDMLDLIVGITSFGDQNCEAEVLIQHGAQIEYKNDHGQSALSRTAGYGSTQVAQFLIDSGADIESRLDTGHTPLHLASWYHHLQILKILIENGANIEAKSVRGSTPLHLAASKNFRTIAQELIAANANVNSKRENGWTPLHYAAHGDFIDTTKLLLSNGAHIEAKDNDERTALVIAARYRAINVAKELIARGAFVDSRTERQWTPLHNAAYNSSTKVLIDHGANIEAETYAGSTPLAVAAYYGSLNIVRILLDAKATVDAPNERERTALHHAASRGHISIVSVLIHNGASKTSMDERGRTPFDVICSDQNLREPCEEDIVTTLQQLLAP
eukprot:g5184.t1